VLAPTPHDAGPAEAKSEAAPDVTTAATPVFVEDTTEPDSATKAASEAAQLKNDIIVGPRRIGWARSPLTTESECWRLRACYRDALATTPGLHGRLVFMLAFEKGKVTSVKTAWREGIPDALVSCVDRVVRGLSMSYDRGGLWLPFRFSTDDPSDVYPDFGL
jgi:hypothetical protein